MNESKLAICIPTYNRLCALKRQIAFLEEEKVFENKLIQVIISDNHSDDGTIEFLKNIKKKYNSILINVNKQNKGLIGNLYSAYDISNSEYIWFVGDDDELKKGLVDEVVSIITQNNDLGHIFINYSTKRNGVIEKDKCYFGKSGYFESGYKMFETIVNNSDSYGLQMFLTANIYRKDFVFEVNSIMGKNNETENLAMPLGYSLFGTKLSGYIIGNSMIIDEIGDISWKSKAILVGCRDMIAVSDIVAKNIGREQEVRKLLLKVYRNEAPEFEYALRCRKFSKNNYALYWLKEYSPITIVKDVFRYPIQLFKRITRRVLN